MNRTIAHTTLTALSGALLIACGGAEDPAGVDAELEANLAAQSVSALSVGAELGAPTAEADDSSPDVMASVNRAYGRRMPCASIGLSNGMLQVDFGSGCPIHGRTVSGAFSVGFTRGSPSTFTLLLADLSGGAGKTSNGSFEMTAGAGQVQTDVALAVQEGGVITDHLFSGVMVPDATGVAFDGTASRDDGTTARDLTFTGLYQEYGECYPNAGQVQVDATGQPTTIVTFDAQSPASGVVQVQIGRLPPQPVTLPACPR